MVIAQPHYTDVRDLVNSGKGMHQDQLARLIIGLHIARDRHQRCHQAIEVIEVIEVIVALSGHDMAAMVGCSLVSASQRHLMVLDGMPTFAAKL